jgi:hypothetical protein
MTGDAELNQSSAADQPELLNGQPNGHAGDSIGEQPESDHIDQRD